jgi:hypothetical protein
VTVWRLGLDSEDSVEIIEQRGRPRRGRAALVSSARCWRARSDRPSKHASCYDEGVRCLGIAATARQPSCFAVLTLFIKDKGSVRAKAERHLRTALKIMNKDGSLHASLLEGRPSEPARQRGCSLGGLPKCH